MYIVHIYLQLASIIMNFNFIINFIDELKIDVSRLFVGTFIVSLNMYGFQLSVIDVSNNPEWIDCLDERTSAFAWPGNHMSIKPIENQESKNIKMPNLDDIDSKVRIIFKSIILVQGRVKKKYQDNFNNILLIYINKERKFTIMAFDKFTTYLYHLFEIDRYPTLFIFISC